MASEASIDQALVNQAVAYHGSLCPGLAVGIQAARLALREVGHASDDNKLIAVAETDICAVDAIQALVGTTLGNRNLVMHDWGKNAFTFFRPGEGTAVRIVGRPAWVSDYHALRTRVQSGAAGPEEVAGLRQAEAAEVARILAMAPEELYDVEQVNESPPATSQVDGWTTCAACGELVMETRTRVRRGETLCVPCFERAIAAGPRHRNLAEAMAGV